MTSSIRTITLSLTDDPKQIASSHQGATTIAMIIVDTKAMEANRSSTYISNALGCRMRVAGVVSGGSIRRLNRRLCRTEIIPIASGHQGATTVVKLVDDATPMRDN